MASRGLLGELVAVRQEEDSLGPAGLQESLQVEADEVGLAGTGRQLDQEAPPAELQRVVERLHRLGLVGPHRARLPLADVVLRDFDGGERPARLPRLHHALEVPLREEAGDGAGVVVLVVPEVGQLPVGEKDEGRFERLGVGQGLLLRHVGVDGVSLGLDDGERAAALVVEDVVGAAG